MITRAAAAEARAAGTKAVADRPRERRRSDGPSSQRTPAKLELRSVEPVERDGMAVVPVGGHASVTEHGYEMYDAFGPYTEVVTRGAFTQTLAASPTVEFALNHGHGGGASMASTRNNTLELSEDDTGLAYDAFVDPSRTDVSDMVKALQRGDLAEASFKFRITSGQWSPDYTEYRINEVDIDGGDVSAVNFGANPAATSALRSTATPDRVDRLRALIAAGLSE